MTFHSVGNVIIPTDFNSMIFRGVGGEKPPTSYDLRDLSMSDGDLSIGWGYVCDRAGVLEDTRPGKHRKNY